MIQWVSITIVRYSQNKSHYKVSSIKELVSQLFLYIPLLVVSHSRDNGSLGRQCTQLDFPLYRYPLGLGRPEDKNYVLGPSHQPGTSSTHGKLSTNYSLPPPPLNTTTPTFLSDENYKLYTLSGKLILSRLNSVIFIKLF